MCHWRGQDRLLQYDLGEYDLMDLPDALCGCGQEMTVRSFAVSQCHLSLAGTERFNNNRRRAYEKSYNAIGKTLTFDTSGHFNKMDLQLASRPFAPAAPKTAKPCALILSVETGRPGADQEQHKAVTFFESLGFSVKLVRNPTAEQMFKEIDHFGSAQTKGGSQKICAVALMAHGREGSITASDGRQVQLSNLFGVLDSARMPKLESVGKFFFIQACRGSGTPLTSDPGMDADAGVEFTRAANFHWCYATTSGLPAYRGKMFQALSDAAQTRRNMPLEEICKAANGTMARAGLLMTVSHTMTQTF
jgi:hypothetical protein